MKEYDNLIYKTGRGNFFNFPTKHSSEGHNKHTIAATHFITGTAVKLFIEPFYSFYYQQNMKISLLLSRNEFWA